MPSREEKLKCVLSAANALGLNISEEVVPGKQLSVINLLLWGYSDTPEDLAKNIESIVFDIKQVESSFVNFYEQFKDAMEFAADDENGEGTNPVPEKKQIMLLKGKLSEKVMERLRTLDQGSDLTQITEYLKECYAKHEVSKEKLRIKINRMKREDFKNYDDYIKELLKLCEQYHMKEEKDTRNKLIIADIVCKHDVQTQRAVENCGIK
uniref:CULLIN_2 domain-containing protein n=1 Tax=Strongyloides papillosus TaxID=174720 RepID=A0A0N5C077_STREA